MRAITWATWAVVAVFWSSLASAQNEPPRAAPTQHVQVQALTPPAPPSAANSAAAANPNGNIPAQQKNTLTIASRNPWIFFGGALLALAFCIVLLFNRNAVSIILRKSKMLGQHRHISSPNANAPAGFSLSAGRADAPLHVAAHSHHPWPDVSRAAQLQCWDDAARLLDRKWEHIFTNVIPTAQHHIARQLNLPDPASIAFGPNTHSFVLRLLSALPVGRPARILTTTSEFYSFSRQIKRLEQDGLVQVTRIHSEPFDDFPERFCAAAAKGGYDLVFFSQVFFDSGYRVPDLAAVVGAVADAETLIVIDGYHGFMAVPSDLSTIAGRAFYLAGGYKYAMAGEGVCFLHCPPGYAMQPRNTGWYAGFAAREGEKSAVTYAQNGARFFGATFDPSGLYRFNAAQDWLQSQGLSAAAMLAYVREMEAAFLAALRPGRLDPANLMLPDPALRARFLTFRTPDAGAIVADLAAHNIIADHRGDRLRIGFGIYHTAEDALRLARALA